MKKLIITIEPPAIIAANALPKIQMNMEGGLTPSEAIGILLMFANQMYTSQLMESQQLQQNAVNNAVAGNNPLMKKT